MPFFDYKCKKCGNSHSKLLKVDDRRKPTEQPCVYCKGDVELVIGPTPMSYSMSRGLKATDS